MENADELQTCYRDGVRLPASPHHPCAVTWKVKGQGNKVMWSIWCIFAHNSTTKNRRSTKIGRKVVRATGDITHQLKGQRSRSSGRLTPWTKISHIFRARRPTNFKLGTLMKYDDPHHRHARMRPTCISGTGRPASLTYAITCKLKAHGGC